MAKIKITLIIIVLLIPVVLSAYDSLWIKTYGGSGVDEAYSIEQTADTGYIVTGSKDNQLWILKLDRYGDTLWTKIYSGQSISVGYDIVEINNGYAVLAKKDNYAWLLILDEYGDTLWTRVYHNMGYRIKSVINASNNGYLLTRCNRIMLVDSLGDSLWIKDDLEGVVTTCKSYDENFISTTTSDAMVCEKFSIENNSLWKKYFTWGMWPEFTPEDIVETKDSGFVITGGFINYHDPECVFLYKADSLGNWIFFSYKNNTMNISEMGMSVVEAYEGGYIITAKITSGEVSLYKTNNVGDSVWLREYGQGLGYCLEKTYDSAYVLVGELNGDLFIMKVDSLGNTGVEEEYEEIADNSIRYNIYSVSNIVNINFSIPSSSHIKLNIYDLTGRLIMTPIDSRFPEGSYEENVRLMREGIYFYELISDFGSTSGRITILR